MGYAPGHTAVNYGCVTIDFFCGCDDLTLNIGSWATYTTVRYFIAYGIYPSNARRSAALPLGISSSLSLLFVIALAISVVLRRPQLRSQRTSLHHALLLLLSFFLIAPGVVSLVLVCVWRHVGSDLSLRGRCHWDVDAVWVGVGGQCVVHAPAWGVWLTAAILRLALTVIAPVRHLLIRSL